MTRPSLGVCYYPEHWPEAQWAEDAERMAALGLTHVRVGEFAWSQLEPTRGDLRFEWLERAIDALHAAGLKVVLGTPTATPPKWLVDENPDILPVGADGQVRGFGSRRHVCFSDESYRNECVRFVTHLAEHFGAHPGIVAWQTDNEYGCHDTALSYSQSALHRFRRWLAARYGSIEALNDAWGNRFWSMEYRDFEAVDLPNRTVTEANPSHRMAFSRFSSEQVRDFNRIQVEILRRLAPGRDILHNYMGRIVDFDHFEVGADLDIATWDSYPLGFLEDRLEVSDDWKRRFCRAGDPDFQAFHHDLYRAVSGGRMWIMEQQPGPVNWAPHNPAPRDGMVRLWTLEAMAHGAELVSYFRWRQCPFAQEQMHSGLLRPDSSEAEGFAEAAAVADDLAAIDWGEATPAPVAIVFDYPSAWAWKIQPQGREFDYFALVFALYRAVRRLGLDVDFVSAQAPDLAARKLVLIPGLFAWTDALKAAVSETGARVLIGPRADSKTEEFRTPEGLPPGLPGDLRVLRVESLRPDTPVAVDGGGRFEGWREHVEGGAVDLHCEDGAPALISRGPQSYLCGWPDASLAGRVLEPLAAAAGLETMPVPEGLGVRRRGEYLFVFNYDDRDHDLSTLNVPGALIRGESVLAPSGVAVFALR